MSGSCVGRAGEGGRTEGDDLRQWYCPAASPQRAQFVRQVWQPEESVRPGCADAARGSKLRIKSAVRTERVSLVPVITMLGPVYRMPVSMEPYIDQHRSRRGRFTEIIFLHVVCPEDTRARLLWRAMGLYRDMGRAQ